MNKFPKNFFDTWNLLYFLSLLVFISQHFLFGQKHFQECDSSGLFEYLNNSSLEDMKYFIRTFTPNILISIRYFFADFSLGISNLPLQKFFQVPYLSTYPPLMGLFYGGLKNQNYESFYLISSLITGLALVTSSILIFLTN